jgi:hypothetical protein
MGRIDLIGAERATVCFGGRAHYRAVKRVYNGFLNKRKMVAGRPVCLIFQIRCV